MRIKRLLSLMLILTLTAGLCACGGADKKPYIAVIVKSVDSDFFHNLKSGVDAAATEYNVTVTFEGPANEEDYVAQNELIAAAVRNGADALVLSAIDYEKSAAVVEEAVRSGVKVVTVDSNVNSSAVSLFIGTDNKEAGKAAAKAAVDGFSATTDIQIGIVNCFESTDNGILREEGFRDYIHEVPNAGVVASVNVESNTDSAEAAAEKLLRENPQINVLVGFNEWMTLGVGNAVKKLGMSETVQSIGFDSNILSVGMIETGEMDALIVQNPFAMGYLGIEKAAALIAGEPVDGGELYTAVTTVTRDNLFDPDIQKIVFKFG